MLEQWQVISGVFWLNTKVLIPMAYVPDILTQHKGTDTYGVRTSWYGSHPSVRNTEDAKPEERRSKHGIELGGTWSNLQRMEPE